MRRFAVLSCVLAIAASCMPSHATSDDWHTILVSSPDPAVARQMVLASDKLNGVTGYVLPLTGVTTERSYELVSRGGATGAEDFDAWFYTSVDGTGSPCPRVPPTNTDLGGESGTMCAGARYAIVVLFTGAYGTFQLRY
jgi:hypothetical protein